MNSKTVKANRNPLIILVAAIGVVAFLGGRLSAPRPDAEREQGQEHEGDPTAPAREQVYTCSMHPQVRTTDPDEVCPICAMELIPVPDDGDEQDDETDVPRLRVSARAEALMEVRTWPAERRDVSVDVSLFGMVELDERTFTDVVLRSPGYVARLPVNFTWQRVAQGDLLAEVYSPEVVAAMSELVRSIQPGGANLDAARERLVRMGVSREQVEELIANGEIPGSYRVASPVDGVVRVLDARAGDRLAEGDRLMQLADLSSVWVQMEAYESDLAWIAEGQPVSFTVPAYPGETFEGAVDYIDPVIDPRKRTVRVRLEVANPDGRLKPGMFARGAVRHAAGSAVPGEEEREPPLVIPATAPLVTGRRAVVYIKVPDADRPTFEPRQVVLGPRAGADYIVREGLEEGDLVVVNGQFKIDSELQIRGRPSMMTARENEVEEVLDPVEAPETFRRAVGGVVALNFELVDALAGDDPETARQAAAILAEALGQVAADGVADEVHAAWQPRARTMTAALRRLADEPDLEVQRRHFEAFSDALTEAARLFPGGMDRPVYRAMCPMVEGREAFWLQPQRQIANPYHGSRMLRCGEIVETLHEPGEEP